MVLLEKRRIQVLRSMAERVEAGHQQHEEEKRRQIRHESG